MQATTNSLGPMQTLQRALQRTVAALTQGWSRLVRKPYRPEKHYMRGPGPKWRAKYATVEARRPRDAVRGR